MFYKGYSDNINNVTLHVGVSFKEQAVNIIMTLVIIQ